MAIKFIDILEPANPETSAIAKSTQIAGARSVETVDDLSKIIPQVLSASFNPADGSHDNDAVGQLWYVNENDQYYILKNFVVDKVDGLWDTSGSTWTEYINDIANSTAISEKIKSGLEDINLQVAVDNQGSNQVILSNILNIIKTPVDTVFPLLLMGDFSSRIGSANTATGLITGFINETMPNDDGTFSITNKIAGAPLTLSFDGTEDNHATTVSQVNQMISTATSSLGISNEVKYTVENPDITPVDTEATWTNVIKYKNSTSITGIDYTNSPIVQVYDTNSGKIVYPGVKLVADNENYTCVNIIFDQITETITAGRYIAVIITSAEVV